MKLQHSAKNDKGMPEDYTKTRTQLFRSGWYCFQTDVVAFGWSRYNDIMSTIPVDDRCRKFADYIVDHWLRVWFFAPDLWASSPQQSTTTTNAAEPFHSHLNADIKTPHPNISVFLQSLTRQQAFYAFCLVFATSFYALYDWHWRCCAFRVTSCNFYVCAFVENTFEFLWQFFALS